MNREREIIGSAEPVRQFLRGLRELSTALACEPKRTAVGFRFASRSWPPALAWCFSGHSAMACPLCGEACTGTPGACPIDEGRMGALDRAEACTELSTASAAVELRLPDARALEARMQNVSGSPRPKF